MSTNAPALKAALFLGLHPAYPVKLLTPPQLSSQLHPTELYYQNCFSYVIVHLIKQLPTLNIDLLIIPM